MTYDDDIALLAEDIKRWAGQDARIHEALEQLLKLYRAEVDALAFEALELDRKLAEERVHNSLWANRNDPKAWRA